MSLLRRLADETGFDSIGEMLETATMEEVCPGICVACRDYTTDVEPDQECGYCENCGADMVKSCLILAGVM